MSFARIIGHERPLQSLRHSLETGRLHHAYLFVGPEGIGMRTIAHSLAKSLHCRERRFDFCDQCPSCFSIRDWNSPDVRLVEPLSGKKDISIKQIRDLIGNISLRSFSGQKKVAIIDPAELMNYHAQNALLKTLEEPPENSLLILVTKSSGALLPTLLSRCLRISFGLLSVEQASEFLMRQKGLDPAESRLRSALTMGSIGQALAWSDAEIKEQRSDWINRYCALAEQDYRGALMFAEELAEDKEKCVTVLQWLEGWHRDVLALQVTGDRSMVRNVDLMETLAHHASANRQELTLRCLFELAAALDALQRTYNRRMILENLLVRLVAWRQARGPQINTSHG
jgi:DNA polymerase-3 subunit delta'